VFLLPSSMMCTCLRATLFQP